MLITVLLPQTSARGMVTTDHAVYGCTAAGTEIYLLFAVLFGNEKAPVGLHMSLMPHALSCFFFQKKFASSIKKVRRIILHLTA